jgi:cytochrome c biogenesis factor
VDIFSFIFHDVYAVLSQIDKNTIHAKIYYQPMISFVWLSILIIALGFGLSWWAVLDNIRTLRKVSMQS